MHKSALVHSTARALAGPAALQAPPRLLLSSSARSPHRIHHHQHRAPSPARAPFHLSARRATEQPAEATVPEPEPEPVEAAQQPAEAPSAEAEEEKAPAREEDKPRRRRTTTTRTTTALPGELPPEYASSHLWLPDAPPTPAPETDSVGLPPPQMLHDALTSLLLCLHPQTQHRSLYPGPGGQSQVEPTLAMYCPMEGGDYVLDATLREVAKRAGAEVVVLDMAQLAAGIHGIFGRSAVGFQLPSNPLHVTAAASSSQSQSQPSANSYAASEEDDDDVDQAQFPPTSSAIISIPTMQYAAVPRTKLAAASAATRGPQAAMRKFFDDIVNLPSMTEVEPVSPVIPMSTTPATSPKPRIIYVRDFGLLAPTSHHWYPPLLAAVRARRAGPIGRPSQPPPNPTVIVFGCTPPLLPQLHIAPAPPGNTLLGMLMGHSRPSSGLVRVEGYDEEDVRGREKRLRDRLAGWERNEPLWLSTQLPMFGGSPPPSTGRANGTGVLAEPYGILLSGGLVGLPQRIGGIGDHSEFVSTGTSAADDGNGPSDARAAPPYFRALTILPAKRDPALETETRLARRREINMLAMRMAVGAVGGVLPDLELGGQELEEEELWKEWGKRVEPWSVIRGVASRAVGGVVAEQVQAGAATMSTGSTLEPTPIPWTAVLDAWAAQRVSHSARKAWLDAARAASVLLPGEADEPAAPAQEGKEDEVIERVRRADDLEESEQRLLGCIVDPVTMPTTFANVHLPPTTIDSIRTIVSLPLLHPQAFSQGILKQHAMTGVLLFGVPGTGKTLVVRALAKESGARMLMIKPSDIMDMYVGQSEKLVRGVFTLARRLSPCIIFLDEIDALFGARVSARESGGAIAHRQVITEFMQEMDGLRTKEGGVIVIGATNRPFDLDDAVLRRLPRRLLVDLPGEKEREEILKILLRDEVLAPEVDIHALAKRTEGFSGSDLKHLCVSAALDAVKETVELPWAVPKNLIKDTLALTAPPPPIPVQAPIPAELTILTQPELTSAQPEGTEVPIAELSPQLDGSDAPEPLPLPTTTASEVTAQANAVQRILRPHHFAKALTEITASTSESLGTLSDLRKWNEEFGEAGNRRGRRKRWGDRFGFGIPAHGPGVREVGQVGGEP
ncbi:AAA-domain-containing protein [Calocera cornea HHB12733]|uniref:AAA-domain-containing protein n=1 Tax=Calocera cornea HHB12733 TaxID=1353952 RepID=A0A165ICG7_9BASI|nr:AAA-domain-containing protein [Calocera cornea HHB12733]